MHANIQKLYLIAGAHGLIFFYSFDKVFLQTKGMSITDVVVIDIIYFLTIILFEVPSGALSDRWSRKYVLVVSSLFFASYISIFAVAQNFITFAGGAIAAGLGTAFLSGTDNSLLFDSLKELGKEDDYEKYLGRKRAIAAVVFVIASGIGGYIGQQYGLEIAFWLSLPSMIVAAIIALGLQEPHFHRTTGEVNYWQHIKATLAFLKSTPKFIHLAGLLTAVMVPTIIFDEYSQVYFAFIGLGALGLGLLGSLNSVFDAVFNTITFWFKRFRHDFLFGILLTIFCAGLLSAWVWVGWIGITLLFVGSVAFYIIDIIAMADVNRQLPSKIRATSESFFGFLATAVYVPVSFLFARVSQEYNAAVGFGTLGLLLTIYTLFYWLSTVRQLRADGKIVR